jgi:hypothetical protein
MRVDDERCIEARSPQRELSRKPSDDYERHQRDHVAQKAAVIDERNA